MSSLDCVPIDAHSPYKHSYIDRAEQRVENEGWKSRQASRLITVREMKNTSDQARATGSSDDFMSNPLDNLKIMVDHVMMMSSVIGLVPIWCVKGFVLVAH